MDLTLLTNLALSLALGLLVGLQRERRGDAIAGIRTFALIALAGTIAGLLAKQYSEWTVPAGGLGLALLLGTAAFLKSREDGKDIGLTTEVAALVVYGLGAYLVEGDRTLALVVGGAVALLLHWKEPLHGFVRGMGEKDMSAIMQFVLIAVVILPILPRDDMGPYDALNPFKIWLVVVLVVSVSLAGYIVSKFVRATAGAALGGLVGGLVSSTATTVSYARMARDQPGTSGLALTAIMVANAVALFRVAVLVALVAPLVFREVAPPLAMLGGILALLAFGAYESGKNETAQRAEHGNPAELKAALWFGGLFALIKLATAWGREQFGAGALYALGAVSGLTDMDAITLSIADSASKGRLSSGVAWRVILIAALSNLVFKAGCVLWLGDAALKKRTLIYFGLAIAAGAVLLAGYPG